MALDVTQSNSCSDERNLPEEHLSQQDSIFSELLVSGSEIEGMFQQRRKQEQDKKSSKKLLSNGLKNPAVALKERLSIYNKKKNEMYHLRLGEEVSYNFYY
jgi:hypothetical protein